MCARVPMIGVGEISAKYRTFSPVHQLPDAIRTPEHASVGMNAHDHHVLDPGFLEEREQLVPVVRPRVDRRDPDRLDLMRPGVRGSARRAWWPGLAGAGSVVR